MTSRLYYYFCRLLFHVQVADLGSGTVGLRKEALEALDLKASGFDIHPQDPPSDSIFCLILSMISFILGFCIIFCMEG